MLVSLSCAVVVVVEAFANPLLNLAFGTQYTLSTHVQPSSQCGRDQIKPERCLCRALSSHPDATVYSMWMKKTKACLSCVEYVTVEY